MYVYAGFLSRIRTFSLAVSMTAFPLQGAYVVPCFLVKHYVLKCGNKVKHSAAYACFVCVCAFVCVYTHMHVHTYTR